MTSPQPSLDPPPALPQRRPVWPIIVGLVALVLVPLLAKEVPREKLRWQVASAVQERLDGNHDQALEILDEVLRKDPDFIPVLLLRAQWQLEDQQGDRALADIDRALKLRPVDGALLVLRSQVYQARGQHAEAVADIDAVLKRIPVDANRVRANYLNMAAYSRAVGKLDLDKALTQIDEALKHLPDETALLDTRGFILYQMGKFDQALPIMQSAVIGMEKNLAEWEQEKRLYSRRGGDLEAEEKRIYRSAAVIFYHRGLVLQAQDKAEQAAKDFAQVRKWGFEPDENLY